MSAGSYRPVGGSNLVLVSGQLNDGCVQCPRGNNNKKTNFNYN
jgi:hypothetical protein